MLHPVHYSAIPRQALEHCLLLMSSASVFFNTLVPCTEHALLSLVMASLPDDIPPQSHTTSYLSRPLQGKSALTSAFRLVWQPSHERGCTAIYPWKQRGMHCHGDGNHTKGSSRQTCVLWTKTHHRNSTIHP